MKLIEVRADDWEGWYVNGDCKWQRHSIDTDVLIDLINREFKLDIQHEIVYADDKWLRERGELPDKLTEVIMEDTGLPYGVKERPSRLSLYE